MHIHVDLSFSLAFSVDELRFLSQTYDTPTDVTMFFVPAGNLFLSTELNFGRNAPSGSKVGAWTKTEPVPSRWKRGVTV